MSQKMAWKTSFTFSKTINTELICKKLYVALKLSKSGRGTCATLFEKHSTPTKLRLVSKYDVLKKVNIGVFLET